MKGLFKRSLFFVLFLPFYSACSEDAEPRLPSPMVTNVELGLGDNGFGVIGRDFHFNADVVAGDKLDTVEITIRQKSGETYLDEWFLSFIWNEYRGLKNANIHQHFDIPKDAVQGDYDFVILVKDKNGQETEIVRDFSIYDKKFLTN
jgi:hypothetical protein